ncbi:hypothetical protein NJB1604_27530, partial [Mycobacterium marinum]
RSPRQLRGPVRSRGPPTRARVRSPRHRSRGRRPRRGSRQPTRLT